MKFAKQRKSNPNPNFDLLVEVRIRFIMEGSTFEAFARNQGISSCNLRKAILGDWTGPKASKLKQLVLEHLNITEKGNE